MNKRTLRHPDGATGGNSASPRDLGHASAELLERYLDGQLDERERRVFEKSLESDPTLREHLKLQARIDSSLKLQLAPTARFVVEHPVGISRTAPNATAPTTTSARDSRERRPAPPRISWLRVAALVAIVMGGYFLYDTLVASRPVTFPHATALITPAAAYANEVKGGMKPYAVCTSSEEFATFTRERLGAALVIEPVEGLALIGWNYTDRVFSDGTITMLATYHDQPIVILMDRVEHARAASCGKALDEDTRTVGGIFLHEVRPKGLPSVLSHFTPAN